MNMEKIIYTTILHKQREELGLSVLEYFLCETIHTLSNPWCYMSKRGLAKTCSVSEATIYNMLSLLVQKGLVERSEKGLKTTDLWRNTVDVEVSKIKSPTLKSGVGVSKIKSHRLQNLESSIYIKDNQKDTISSPKVEDCRTPQEKLKILPPWMGPNPLARIVFMYSLLWEERYGFEPTITNWGQLGKLFKPLLSLYTEYQLSALVWMHLNWAGANGDSEFDRNFLSNRCYPLDLLPRAVNNYKAYLMNTLSVNFDDEMSVKVWVVKEFSTLINAKRKITSQDSVPAGDSSSFLQEAGAGEAGEVSNASTGE